MNKVALYEESYNIDGTNNGPCLLKVIIQQSTIDTNATVRNIKMELANPDTYLPTVGEDIEKLNRHVRSLVKKLSAR